MFDSVDGNEIDTFDAPNVKKKFPLRVTVSTIRTWKAYDFAGIACVTLITYEKFTCFT